MPKTFPSGLRGIDVPGANDNCFFHAYAAHLLASNQPLPQELFSFNSILGENSPASQLQRSFPNQQALDLFAAYDQRMTGQPATSNFLVEKVLVAGSLMREWFASKMSEDTKHRDEMSANVVKQFNAYKEFVNVGVPSEELLSGPEGVLYIANAAFLNYFTNGPKNPDALTEQEEHFSGYFRKNKDNVDGALQDYWLDEGYKAYCQQLALADTKLAPNDVLPVLSSLGQPVVIEGTTTQTPTTAAGVQPIQLIMDAQEGHYYLVPTAQTQEKLSEFESSYKKYLNTRERILAVETHDPRVKFAVADNYKALFVGALCNKSNTGEDPMQAMIAKVGRMQESVMHGDYFNAFCGYIQSGLNQLIVCGGKQDTLAQYHKHLEPCINQWMASPLVRPHERTVLAGYKQIFNEEEVELTGVARQAETRLRTRLESKLNELLLYSEHLDAQLGKHPKPGSRLHGVDLQLEAKTVRQAIHDLCSTLSNSPFNTNTALSLVQEDLGKGSYKERYIQAVGDAQPCAQEVREEAGEERIITPRPMQSH